jgi:MFS family permease
MIVLSITLLGEFLMANVSIPFLIFMVEGFDEFPEGADVGFATGLLVAAFFFTQFLTSLLWATVAERHGQRLVLFVSLLGGSLTCALFGTSTSLKQAIVIRLMQGVFAGAIGVARSCVTVISDPSNEGRAYAILGFCWGLGGVAGAIVGGACQSRVSYRLYVGHGLTTFVYNSRNSCAKMARCFWKDPSFREVSLPAAYLHRSLCHNDRCVTATCFVSCPYTQYHHQVVSFVSSLARTVAPARVPSACRPRRSRM